MNFISVIIPAYNAEKYIKDAIESILDQRHENLEILVIDDGSTDQTASLAASYFPIVQCISQKNMGIGAARNCGLRLARGDFFAFLDADDLWMADKLQCQFGYFANNSELDGVFGHVVQFASEDCPSPSFKEEPLRGFVPGTLLIRREAFWKVGLFSEGKIWGETVDWYGRLLQVGLNTAMASEVVLKRRIHANNSGRHRSTEYRHYAWHLKKLLDQKRENSHAS